MQGLKDCNGKVDTDLLREEAQEIATHPKYRIGFRSGAVDSEFLDATPQGLASGATLFAAGALAIYGSAHALDTETEMKQYALKCEQQDIQRCNLLRRQKALRDLMAKIENEINKGPRYDDGTANA